MLLIGLGSKAKNGKDTVAQAFKEALGNSVRLYSFANELKTYCKDHHAELLLDWQVANGTEEVPVSKEDPIYGYSAILQYYGTDIVRAKDPNHWVKALEHRIEVEQPEIAVITDVRFLNEATWIKENGGTLIDVIRRKKDGTRWLDPNRDPNHISETALDEYLGWDYVLLAGDGEIEKLKSKALGVLHNVIRERASGLA